MKKEEFDLIMKFTTIQSMRSKMEPYMNETDIMHFESNCCEPYTNTKLDALKFLIKVVEEESGQNFSRMMWEN